MLSNSVTHENLDSLSPEEWIDRRRRNAYDLAPLSERTRFNAPPVGGSRAPFQYPGAQVDTDEELAELRRQQAAFHSGVEKVDKQNRWMLAPILAPELLLAIPEFVGLLAIRQLAKSAPAAVGRVTESSTAVKAANSAGRRVPLSETGSALRSRGRAIFSRANGMSARQMAPGGEVHHRVGIEFLDLFRRAPPNRTANLVGLPEDAHLMASRMIADFKRGLGGRAPTQAEVIALAIRMDKALAPYVLRVGLPRPPPRVF